MSATPTRYVIVDVEPIEKLYYTDGLQLANAGVAKQFVAFPTFR